MKDYDPFARLRETLGKIDEEPDAPEARETAPEGAVVDPFEMLEGSPQKAGVGFLAEVPVDRIVPSPYQVRPSPADSPKEEAAIQELAQSIERMGLLHPPLLRRLPDQRYQLIAGHRRLEAVRRLGWEKVPAYVTDFDDATALLAHIAENTIRRDLDVVARAEAAMLLLTHTLGLERQEVLRRVGQYANYTRGLRTNPPEDYEQIVGTLRSAGLSPDAFIRQHAPVLRLPAPIVRAVQARIIPFPVARTMVKLLSEEQLADAARYIQEHVGDRDAILAYIQVLLERARPEFSRERVAERIRSLARRLPRDPELLKELVPLIQALEDKIKDLKQARKKGGAPTPEA